MKFVFLEVSQASEPWASEASLLYEKKIKNFVDFSIQSIQKKKSSRSNSENKIQAESDELLKQLQPADQVILFDEKGKSLNSEQFAKFLERSLASGKHRCVWILGGAFGVSDEVKARANDKICLAPFVMNHLVAKTVAMEQIYRGFTILKNLPYHNS